MAFRGTTSINFVSAPQTSSDTKASMDPKGQELNLLSNPAPWDESDERTLKLGASLDSPRTAQLSEH